MPTTPPAASTDDDSDGANRAAKGTALMRTMLGDTKVDQMAERNKIAPRWNRWTTEVLYGDVWQGGVLDLRQRSTITIAALVSMARSRELETHIRGGLVNGLTVDEVSDIVQHVGFYAGWPATAEALTILRRIIDEDANAATDITAGP